MTLILRDTKGSRLRGVAFETVVIKDPVAISILMKYKAAGRVHLFNGTSAEFSALYKSAVAFFRLSHPKPTPHGIRRWGGFLAFSGPWLIRPNRRTRSVGDGAKC